MNEGKNVHAFPNGLPLIDLESFRAVAFEGSFTKAARRLGVSQSALSHRLRKLEARLGVRLLNRTTRSLTPTSEGAQLLDVLARSFGALETVFEEIENARGKISGTVRLTAAPDVAQFLLWPRLAPLLATYPDLIVEISADRALVDISAEGFDAGVRLGERLEHDMISVPISDPQRMLAVTAPGYFSGRDVPRTPQALPVRECFGLRFGSGALYKWEFEKEGRRLEITPKGQLISNQTELLLEAVKQGRGIGFVLEMQAGPAIARGELAAFLEDWSPPFDGFRLYYPSRRHRSAAFLKVLTALRNGAASFLPR